MIVIDINKIQLQWRDKKTNNVYHRMTINIPLDKTTEQNTKESTTEKEIYTPTDDKEGDTY